MQFEQQLFEIKTTSKKGNEYAQFEITPLNQGYGHTLGVALRRVLLSSLPGAAITEVKISNVRHQFSTLKGMDADIVSFVLNLKKVNVAYEGDKPEKLTLSVKGPGTVTAADIKLPATVKIMNPDLVLANLSKDGKLEATMQVESGFGYMSSENREIESIGTIPVDAIFSPIVRVNYQVEETRVGRLTNYDKLILDVWTNGTVEPKEALLQSTKILMSYLNQIVTPKEIKKDEPIVVDEGLGMVGKLSVEEIGLPTRVANALVKTGYETVEKLVTAKKEDLVKVRNLGEKSFKIIKAALSEKGVEWNE